MIIGICVPTLVAHAQRSAVPTIGFLSSLSASDRVRVVPAFQQGLIEVGFTEGRNMAVEYRWAEGQYERLPGLAVELVQRQAVMAAISGTPSALAAKAATTTQFRSCSPLAAIRSRPAW